MKNENFDIMGNIKTIEKYKTYLIGFVADFFSTANKSRESSAYNDEMAEELADIIICSYLVGRRIGIPYEVVEKKIIDKIKLGLLDGEDLSAQQQDYRELFTHLREGRRK